MESIEMEKVPDTVSAESTSEADPQIQSTTSGEHSKESPIEDSTISSSSIADTNTVVESPQKDDTVVDSELRISEVSSGVELNKDTSSTANTTTLDTVTEESEVDATSKELVETESETTTAQEESRPKLSDLRIEKPDHSFSKHLEPKASESPPLLLLQGTTGVIEDDSVFSGSDLHQIPDQLLAEPSTDDPEELEARTEKEIVSNIEEQLREFEGSDDESLLQKETVAGEDNQDSIGDDLPTSKLTNKDDTDEDAKHMEKKNEEKTKTLSQEDRTESPKSTEAIEKQASESRSRKNEKSVSTPDSNEEPTPLPVSSADQTTLADMSATNDDLSNDSLNTSDKTIPFVEVDVNMSAKETSIDVEEKDVFADIHNENSQSIPGESRSEKELEKDEQDQSKSPMEKDDPKGEKDTDEAEKMDVDTEDSVQPVEIENHPVDPIGQSEEDTSAQKTSSENYSADKDMEPKDSTKTKAQDTEEIVLCVVQTKTRTEQSGEKDSKLISNSNQKSNVLKCSESLDSSVVEHMDVDSSKGSDDNDKTKGDGKEKCSQSKETNTKVEERISKRIKPPADTEKSKPSTDKGKKNNSKEKETSLDTMEVDEVEELSKELSKDKNVEVTKLPQKVENDDEVKQKNTEQSSVDVEILDVEEMLTNDQQETSNKEGNLDEVDKLKGADEEICLLPDSEQDLTEADKERAILAKEQSHKEEISKAESSSVNDDCTNLDEEGSDITSADGNTPEEDTSEIRPNEITELSNAVKDVKCYKCKKLKSCKYKALIDGEHKYFCDYKCVQFFRHANKDLYKLNSKKIIITSTVEMKNFCSRCKTQKNCRYQFFDPEISTTTSYLCDTRCLDHITGQNVDKYVLRSKRYIVEEMLKDEQKKCYHCGENKACKYFFLHDDERFYICHDDCFNLLAKEQPDKFRIKRRVVRVRDLRATSTNVTSTETEKDKIVARTEQEAEVARRERESSFIRRCAHCFQQIQFNDNTLCWETLDFCNEVCLKAYQFLIGSSCTMCKQRVSLQSLGKYCVRFGFEVRQFCRSTCLDNFKKGLKVCSYCQKDISKTKDGFLAPVGDKNQFKDFCSQTCMVKYEGICTPKKKFPIVCCSVCNAEKQSSVEVTLDDRTYNFCSNPCFSAFKFVNNIVPDQCLVCLKYFERKSADNFTLYQDQVAQVFCCKICLNIFIILNRKIVPCEWCKVKKYNFDMIQQKSGNIMLMLCSISCLTYYRSSMNAVSVKKQICDHCLSEATSQYHLTMSDATVRNFCTYHCVMEFQSQFGHKPLTLDQPETNKITTATQPVPTGLPKRIKSKANAIPMQQTTTTTKTSTTKVTILPVQQKQVTKSAVPVISNVTSLAPQTTMASSTAASSTTRALRGGRGRQTQQTQSTTIQTETEKLSSQNVLSVKKVTPITTRRSAATSNSVVTQVVQESTKPVEASTTFTNSSTQTTRPQKKNVGVNVGDSSVSSTGALPVTQKQGTASEPKIEYKTNVVTLPPKPPLVANKQTMCKPSYVSKGVSCRPHSVSTACQTDASIGNKVLIPIPVPIYVPQPMCMYSLPFPCPVPIPLPIPIPIFIPTTRNSAEGIMKEIKKIQEKMPSDPFEAELLMMAALVADDKKKNDSDSETEEEHHEQAIIEPEYPTETIEPSNSFGEDMLQMALKMATEYDEPAVDLESAMTSNTISHAGSGDEIVDDHEIHQAHMMIMEPQRQVDLAMRAKKRPASPGIKLNRPGVATPNKKVRKVEVRPSSQVVEKPDANMCLKYTFGVNAWKQWIMTKNADLEKTSIRRKPFKTELLQLTADELNYSLSLFVKEVRKPNGSEYAPDTIYYLVLGIQQYLYENNRIDNIFTDPYYERFTDCLDEVARKFSVLYNDAQYIVTRVEEEHLWECKQLGAHSPHVLLSTLMFFNTKHFNLTTVEEHMQLSFSHIMKHWKRSPPGTKLPGSRNVLLRFYPPQTGEPNPRKKKVYEQQENDENPLRCPVKLYEFYLSKCPESVKTRNDVFYLQPERSCVPDSPVWYSTQPLSKEALNKMLHRVKMVKEINIALLSS